VLARPNDVLTG